MRKPWIEIYCDESRQELFWSRKRKGARYIVIGGIWLKRNDRPKIKERVIALRKRYKTYGEIKWRNVAPSRLDFYKALVELFLERDLRFRCIVIDKDQLDLVRFHSSDEELGFYKFYYQLLHHWIEDFSRYSVFVDLRTSGSPSRVKELYNVLCNANLAAEIVQIQALPSEESFFIQLADFLVGAVGYSAHGRDESEAKHAIITMLENRLGRRELCEHTWRTEDKFNVFRIQLQKSR
jgi:hypothetical protein